MKNILAVTACLKRCSVAVQYENRVYEVNENADAAANLVHIANKLLKANDIDIKKLNGVITASGPGSFTGIRVAQGFAKGVALARNIPSVSVSYFDVIQKVYGQFSNNLVVVIKSEKNQAYYKIVKDNCIGVAPYDELYDLFPKDSTIIGEQLPCDLNVIEIPDFREAKHLLQFTELLNENSTITPLYINAKL
ncbi:MAG: tRNA (adenosine(37)-N6)-threonylcarbamoyltransferase complex dimerization subunit type 1 TsaB [Alphaproteobacteria bacterium]|nr:tRNA (adenosine(37)-N6)-threonylcarbamoyltransferase complex dimerization subunit type 1 TsaB [Alphaproteobacteria bacterium]